MLLEQFNPGTDLALVIKMLKKQKDYDATTQHPNEGPYIKGQAGTGNLVRLEDIDESWVRKYLVEALIGIKRNRDGGIREYERIHREAAPILNADGELTEISELLIDTQEYSPMEIAAAKSKLPYILKRLFDKGIALKVSAISLIIAYEKAKKHSNGAPGPGAILAEGVYQVDGKGDIVRRFPLSANSGKIYPVACDWIRGFTPDAYFQDAMSLLEICRTLHIDITQEDPYEFQSDNISKMRVTYITKNRDYLRGGRQRNLSVLASLQEARISDYEVARDADLSIKQLAVNTVHAALDCDDTNVQRVLASAPDIAGMNAFFRIYGALNKDFRVTRRQHMEALSARYKSTPGDNALFVPMLLDFYTQDGFLYSASDPTTPVLFNLKRFTNIQGYISGYAVAHASGHFFLVTDGSTLFHLEVGELVAYMNDFLAGDTNGRYTRNRKYGSWDACFV